MKLADAMSKAILGALPLGVIETDEGTTIEVKPPECPDMYANLSITERGSKAYRMVGYLETAAMPACYPPGMPFLANARVLIAESANELALTWSSVANAGDARERLTEECVRAGWLSESAFENGAQLWSRPGWSRHLIHRGPMLAIVDQVVASS